MKKITLLSMALLSSVSLPHAADTLDMCVIDTEGGKALLIVSPAGQSMWIDAGFPGYKDRDAIRIEVSHHGNDISNSPALVHALRPRVAIMNNGARKVGAPAALKVIRSSPGLEALYQLHWSVRGAEDNAPEEFIANLQDSPDGKWIKVSASQDGGFTVTNGRTGASKTFKR
jgi:hypothetical protein